MHHAAVLQTADERGEEEDFRRGFCVTLPGKTYSSLNGQKPEYKAIIFISPSFLYSPFLQNEYCFIEGQFPVRLLPERHGCAHLRLLHHNSLQRQEGSRERPRLQSHAVRTPSNPSVLHQPISIRMWVLSLEMCFKPATVVHLFRFKMCVITF